MAADQLHQTTDAEEWATIAALLRDGCSLPDRLQRKYDAHMREVRANATLGMKSPLRT